MIFLLLQFLLISRVIATHQLINLTRLSELFADHRPSFNDLLLSQRYERITCSDVDLERSQRRTLWREHGLVVSPIHKPLETYTKLTTVGYDNETQTRACLNNKTPGALPTCFIAMTERCDGFSSCLDDECGCGEEYLRCASGGGCISVDQVKLKIVSWKHMGLCYLSTVFLKS